MARRLTTKRWMAVVGGLGFSFSYGIASPQAQDLISLELVKSLYEAGGQEQRIATALSNGLMMGFMTANATLEYRGDALLYCSPAKLYMNGEFLYRQVLSWSAGQQSRVDMAYSVASILALEEAFPCD